MATTTLIVEFVVVGLTALCWMVMFLFAWLGLDPGAVHDWAALSGGWTPALAVGAVVLAYQLGWILDYGSYWLFYYMWNVRSIKREYVADNRWWAVYSAVHQKAQDGISHHLRALLSVIRLSRTAAVNFPLIAVATFVWIGPNRLSWYVFLVSMTIMAGSLWMMRVYWMHWYALIAASFDAGRDNSVLPAVIPSKLKDAYWANPAALEFAEDLALEYEKMKKKPPPRQAVIRWLLADVEHILEANRTLQSNEGAKEEAFRRLANAITAKDKQPAAAGAER